MSIAERYDQLEAGYKQQIELAKKSIQLYSGIIEMSTGELQAKCIRLKKEMENALERLINSLNNLK